MISASTRKAIGPAIPVAGLVVLGLGYFTLRRLGASSPLAVDAGVVPSAAPTLIPDFTGPLGAELQRAKDNGWDVLFAASEAAHGLPPGILSAIASRETNTKNIVGDGGHGRGLMQIDDRSHSSWLVGHGAGDGGAPDVGAAIDLAGSMIAASIAHGRANGVADSDLLKYAASAYNAGDGNALTGYKSSGDSDSRTTGHNYGADVLRRWHDMYPGQGEPTLTPPQVSGWTPEPMVGAIDPAALSPALASLLAQVDALWPSRDTASDGGSADTDEPDHLAGNAIDLTNDPSNGPDLAQLAEVILGDPRTHYVIWDARIANRDIQGGAWRAYPERKANESDADYSARAQGYNRHSRHMHVSVRKSGRNDGSAWPKGVPGALASASAPPAPSPSSDARLPGLLKQGISALWDQGLVDNFRWVPLTIGPYQVEVMADAASVYGLRMPASFTDMLHMARSVTDIMPITRAVSDARWAAGKHVVLDPIPGGAHLADGDDPIGVQQVQRWDASLGPVSTGALLDGGWKEWVIEPNIADGRAVNYGLRRPDGSVWQTPGHSHDANWKDYSQLATFMKRSALKNGQPVDLLEELKSAGSLGGPIPQWIAAKLGGIS